jgi:hypothetical protein
MKSWEIVEMHLGNLHIKKKIRENHKSGVIMLKFAYNHQFDNILATIAANHLTIYNTDNLGQNHLDLMSHYISQSSSLSKGSVIPPCSP